MPRRDLFDLPLLAHDTGRSIEPYRLPARLRPFEDALREFDDRYGTATDLYEVTQEIDGPPTLRLRTTAPPHIARLLPSFLESHVPEDFNVEVETTHLERLSWRTGSIGMVRGSYDGPPTLSHEALDLVASNFDVVRGLGEDDVALRERVRRTMSPYSTARRAPAPVRAKLGPAQMSATRKQPTPNKAVKPPPAPTRYDQINDDWLDETG